MRNRALITGLLASIALAGCGDDTKVTTVPVERNADGELAVIEKEGGSVDEIDERTAQDELAKRVARTVHVAIETYYTERTTYEGATTDELKSSTAELRDTGATTWKTEDLTRSSFMIEAKSDSGTIFAIAREPDGTVSRPCEPAVSGGCDPSGAW